MLAPCSSWSWTCLSAVAGGAPQQQWHAALAVLVWCGMGGWWWMQATKAAMLL